MVVANELGEARWWLLGRKADMPLKKSVGNMYDWVTHMWSPILGCSHQCSYCYVRKNHKLPEIPVLDPNDFPDLGTGKVIFVGHLCDMFCEAARPEDIREVMAHVLRFEEGNEFVFQTKNVARLIGYMHLLPKKCTVGTTVETNRTRALAELSKAPPPSERIQALRKVQAGTKFITIEPVLDFDTYEFATLIASAKPDFINIGADSKGHNLVEPTKEKIVTFVAALQEAGVTIRKKINLKRILGVEPSELFGPEK